MVSRSPSPIPMIFTPRASNSALRSRNPQPSTVHPYVPAAGKNHTTVGLPAMLGGPLELPSELVAPNSGRAIVARGTSPLRSRPRISSSVVTVTVSEGSDASATSEASLESEASLGSDVSLSSDDASLASAVAEPSDASVASDSSLASVASEVSVVSKYRSHLPLLKGQKWSLTDRCSHLSIQ